MEPALLLASRQTTPHAPPHLLLVMYVQTNANVAFCADPEPGEPDKRLDYHKEKKLRRGRIELPHPSQGVGAFESNTIHGMIGISMRLGLCRRPRFAMQWGLNEWDSCSPVRRCMQRDFFILLYCRFLHANLPGAPSRFVNGEHNTEYDSLYHVR